VKGESAITLWTVARPLVSSQGSGPFAGGSACQAHLQIAQRCHIIHKETPVPTGQTIQIDDPLNGRDGLVECLCVVFAGGDGVLALVEFLAGYREPMPVRCKRQRDKNRLEPASV